MNSDERHRRRTLEYLRTLDRTNLHNQEPEREAVTPDQELREAANTIARLAERATPGPWRYNPDKHWRKPGTTLFEEGVFAGPRGDDATCVAVTGDSDDPQSMDDANWIATLSPAVAAPLADLLWDAVDDEGEPDPSALWLARLINAVRLTNGDTR